MWEGRQRQVRAKSSEGLISRSEGREIRSHRHERKVGLGLQGSRRLYKRASPRRPWRVNAGVESRVTDSFYSVLGAWRMMQHLEVTALINQAEIRN